MRLTAVLATFRSNNLHIILQLIKLLGYDLTPIIWQYNRTNPAT